MRASSTIQQRRVGALEQRATSNGTSTTSASARTAAAERMLGLNGDLRGHEASALSLNATHLKPNPLQASNMVEFTRTQRLRLLTTNDSHYVVGLNRSCEADSDEEMEDEEEPFNDMEEVLWQGQRRLVLGTRHGTPCSFPRERISEWRSHRPTDNDSPYPSSASLPCSFPPGRGSCRPAGSDSPYPSSASLPCSFPPGRISHRSASNVPEATSVTTKRNSLQESRNLSRSCPAAGPRAFYQVLSCSPTLHPRVHSMEETVSLPAAGNTAAMAPARLPVHAVALSGDRQNDQRGVGVDDWGRSNSRPCQQVRRHSDGSSTNESFYVARSGRSISVTTRSCSFPGNYRSQASKGPSYVLEQHAFRDGGSWRERHW